MKIHNVIQKSPEWDRLRMIYFTASMFDAFCLEPCKVNLSVDELKAELDRMGIPRKGLVKKDDLIAVLPNADAYRALSGSALTAISRKLHHIRIQGIRDKQPEQRTAAEACLLMWQDEADAQFDKKMGYSLAVRIGNEMEPAARLAYEQLTGYKVQEIGFVSHDTGGFGCSPDGLIQDGGEWSHGIEIKCPMERHTQYVIEQKLPDDYFYQVHGSMAVTGLNRWDFVSYMPGEPPLIVTVERDETTARLESGLMELVGHMDKVREKLAEHWRNAHARQPKLKGGAA